MTFDGCESWTILSNIEQNIKRKIECYGVKLKDWDVNIYRGVLTGLNEAFIISGAKKDELIAADPKSAEIIRPILRGRDIKRYEYTFADLWLITTFPSKKYDIDDYPAVKDYLLSFGIERLEQTGKSHIVEGKNIKSRKKTKNKWFETQDSINYWDDFSKQKIVWGEISDKPKFAIDLDGDFIAEATTFLMVGDHLKYLICFLNSSVSEYFFAKYGTTTGMGTLRWKKYLVELLPVPQITADNEQKLSQVLDTLLSADKHDKAYWKAQINNRIYEIFNFSNEEIKFIENAINNGVH